MILKYYLQAKNYEQQLQFRLMNKKECLITDYILI